MLTRLESSQTTSAVSMLRLYISGPISLDRRLRTAELSANATHTSVKGVLVFHSVSVISWLVYSRHSMLRNYSHKEPRELIPPGLKPYLERSTTLK